LIATSLQKVSLITTNLVDAEITVAQVRSSSARGVLMTLLLSGCSSIFAPQTNYRPPSPPTQAAVIAAVKKVASDAKLSLPLEISDVRPTDHGPGSYFVCMREVVGSTSEKRTAYSVFYDNDDYKGARLSVIVDACEAQAFTPIDTTPSPSPSPKSAKLDRK
jgi:hypothetical protein